MKKVFIIFILCTACSQVKNEVIQAVLENADIQFVDTYDYEYTDSQKIKVQRMTNFTIVDGVKMDSTLIISDYKYDDKYRLIERTNLVALSETSESGDFDQPWYLFYPPKTLYYYNAMDSVIAEYTLNQRGDTTFLVESEYDGTKLIKQRIRSLNTSYDETIGKSGLYDTTYNYSTYFYADNRKEKLIERDKNNLITNKHEFVYEDTLLVKSLRYQYLFGEPTLDETTEYDYSKNSESPQIVTKRFDKFTAEMSIQRLEQTIQLNNQKVRVIFDFEASTVDSAFYDSDSRINLSIETNVAADSKIIETYEYDDFGNIRELHRTTKTD